MIKMHQFEAAEILNLLKAHQATSDPESLKGRKAHAAINSLSIAIEKQRTNAYCKWCKGVVHSMDEAVGIWTVGVYHKECWLKMPDKCQFDRIVGKEEQATPAQTTAAPKVAPTAAPATETAQTTVTPLPDKFVGCEPTEMVTKTVTRTVTKTAPAVPRKRGANG